MSIELENPETILEKVDAIGNFIAQMFLAHRMKDETQFKLAHDRASELTFDLMGELECQS